MEVYTAASLWRKVGIKLLEEKFPGCLNLKYGEFRLPLSVSLCDAFDHVMDSNNDETDRRETYILLEAKLNEAIKNYTHISKSHSCAEYLDLVRKAIINIDSLELDLIPINTIIIKCQQAIRNGVGERKDLIRGVDNRWCTKKATLAPTDNVWSAFKLFYVKGLRSLDQDGLIDGRKGRAKSAIDDAIKSLQIRADNAEHDLQVMDSALSANAA